jgi:FMN phosphatase YigB (HAD superfamily)
MCRSPGSKMAMNRMEDLKKGGQMILWDMDATLVTEDPRHPLDPKKTVPVTRKFYPGIIDLFQQFHSQYRMTILSTDLQKDEVVSFLQVNQIHQCIHEIYCSDDHLLQEEEGHSTSNIFEFILKRAQIQKSDCVYIRSCDNSAHHQMAKEMGIYSIATAFGQGHALSEGLFSPNSLTVDFLKIPHLKLFIPWMS